MIDILVNNKLVLSFNEQQQQEEEENWLNKINVINYEWYNYN